MVDVAVETVVKAVLADSPHVVMVLQTSVVMLCTVELPVVPEKNDVESVTVSVHRGTAELTVHDDADELAVDVCVEDGGDSDGELDVFLSSFSRSSAISLRAFVRVSISAMGGTGASTALTRLSTTFVAQERSLTASPTRSVIPEIKLLLAIKRLSRLSEIAYLFLFVFEQSGFGSGLTSKALKRESVSSLVFLTSSIYSCFRLESVMRFRLA